MKKINILLLLIFISSTIFAQWNQQFGPPPWFNGIKTDGTVKNVGIGNFANPNDIKARLHVNSNVMPTSWWFFNLNYSPGHLFRTDGPANRDNMWQMFTGSNYSNATEKGRFYVPKKSKDFYVQASSGSLVFNTNGNNTQMKLDTKGFLTINTLATGNNTLVIANKNGTLVPINIENTIAESNTILELKKQITELQTQINQLLLLAKNE
jgi:hypothetical protein